MIVTRLLLFLLGTSVASCHVLRTEHAQAAIPVFSKPGELSKYVAHLLPGSANIFYKPQFFIPSGFQMGRTADCEPEALEELTTHGAETPANLPDPVVDSKPNEISGTPILPSFLEMPVFEEPKTSAPEVIPAIIPESPFPPIPENKPVDIPEAPTLPPFVLSALPEIPYTEQQPEIHPAIPEAPVVAEMTPIGVPSLLELPVFEEPKTSAPEVIPAIIPESPLPLSPENKPIEIPEAPTLPPFVFPALPEIPYTEQQPEIHPAIPEAPVVAEMTPIGVPSLLELPVFEEPKTSAPEVIPAIIPESPLPLSPEKKPIEIPEAPTLPPFVLPALPEIPYTEQQPEIHPAIPEAPIVAEMTPIVLPSLPELPVFEEPKTSAPEVIPAKIPESPLPSTLENKPIEISEAPTLPLFVMPELPEIESEQQHLEVHPAVPETPIVSDMAPEINPEIHPIEKIPEPPVLPPFVMPDLPVFPVENKDIQSEVQPESTNEDKPIEIPNGPILVPFVPPFPEIVNEEKNPESNEIYQIVPEVPVLAPLPLPEQPASAFEESMPVFKPLETIPEPPMLPLLVMPELPELPVVNLEAKPESIKEDKPIKLPEGPTTIPGNDLEDHHDTISESPVSDSLSLPEAPTQNFIINVPEFKPLETIPEAPVLPPFVMPELPVLPEVPNSNDAKESDLEPQPEQDIKPIEIPAAPQLPPLVSPLLPNFGPAVHTEEKEISQAPSLIPQELPAPLPNYPPVLSPITENNQKPVGPSSNQDLCIQNLIIDRAPLNVILANKDYENSRALYNRFLNRV